MKEGKFDYLFQDYPKYLTKEEFYKIAHISKATARYLLQSGKVPCKDTGKKTHRYLIPTENAIRYLEDREIHPDEYEAEPGWYSGKVKHGKKRRRSKKRKQKINAARNKLKELTDAKLEELEDLLDINDICRLTGFSNTAVLRWCRSGKLKAFMVSGKYLIPKVCLKDYIATKCGAGKIKQKKESQPSTETYQDITTTISDDEAKWRAHESMLAKYGAGDTVWFGPQNVSLDEESHNAVVRLLKEGNIPLTLDIAIALRLSQREIAEIKEANRQKGYNHRKT